MLGNHFLQLVFRSARHAVHFRASSYNLEQPSVLREVSTGSERRNVNYEVLSLFLGVPVQFTCTPETSKTRSTVENIPGAGHNRLNDVLPLPRVVNSSG